MAEDVSATSELQPDLEPDASSELEPRSSAPPVTTAVVEAETARPVGVIDDHTRAERARRSAYRFRFLLIYFALAIVAGSAVGAFVVVLSRPKATPPPPWSSLVPTGAATARLYQIIDQIPRHYRLENGDQLVAASLAPPQQLISPDGQSTTLIPIDRMQINERGTITTVSAGGSVQVTLIGNGTDGAIATGKPSQARYYFLQREALEISLYALKYVDQLDSVTVLLPPSFSLNGKTQQRQDTAIFLRRSDVLPVLSRPLRATLSTAVPDPTAMTPEDLRAVRNLGIPHTFTYSLTRSPDGTFVRVFEPPTG